VAVYKKTTTTASAIYHQGNNTIMSEEKEYACSCGNSMMRLILTDSGALEIKCTECGTVRKVGRGLCPTRLVD